MSAEEAQVQPPQQVIDLSDYQFSGNPFTVERKCAFVRALREYGSIFHTAQAVGCSRRAVYDWIEADEQFAQAVSDIREDNYDDLETSVYKRAFKSDLLAMFYLKAHRPKYRDKIQVDLSTVQDEIDRMVSKMDEVSRRQLPQALTEFIDTDYSESEQEYQRVTPASDNQQKEDSPTLD